MREQDIRQIPASEKIPAQVILNVTLLARSLADPLFPEISSTHASTMSHLHSDHLRFRPPSTYVEDLYFRANPELSGHFTMIVA